MSRLGRRGGAGLALAIALLVFVVARLFGIQPLLVTSGSMLPTVQSGDWAVRQSASVNDLGRGDIAVFRYPSGADQLAIKRVVAVAGDRVMVTKTAVQTHGKTFSTRTGTVKFQPNRPHTVTVPAKSVFLLGDNRTGSIDSRHFGPVKAKDVAGRVLFVFPDWVLSVLVAVGLLLLMVLAWPSGRRESAAPAPVALVEPGQLARFDNYADAQHAVDFLSDGGFPVQHCRIVGTGLQQVEDVTGRLTWGKVALAGLLAGAWVGLMVGLVLGVFAQSGAGPSVILGATGLGAIMFAVASLVGYASTGGRRDFTSKTRIEATQYEVLVDQAHRKQAAAILATLTK